MIVRPGGLIVRKGCGEFRPVRDGEALWPVCEAAPVGDGGVNLTFMRLPCMQPRNVLGIAEEEITARLQVAGNLTEENILRLLIEIDERIAKENNVEEAIERPSGVHEIDAFELYEPGDIRLYAHSALTSCFRLQSSPD